MGKSSFVFGLIRVLVLLHPIELVPLTPSDLDRSSRLNLGFRLADQTLFKKYNYQGDGTMLLQKKENGTLIEIQDLIATINPNQMELMGRVQSGEEEQIGRAHV